MNGRRTAQGVLGGLVVLAMVWAATPAVARSAPVVSDVPQQTTSFNGPVRAVAIHHGVTYVGGEFTQAVWNGKTVTRQHLAAINSATGALLPWHPKADNTVFAIAMKGRWAYLGGAFKKVNGRAHSRLARVSTSGGKVDPQYHARTNRKVLTLAVSGATLYAGGLFTRADGRAKPRLAAFDTGKGALRRAWKPRPNGRVLTLRVAHKRVYVGGAFTQMDGATRGSHLAPVDRVTGALKHGFTSNVTYRVSSLVVTGNAIYAAADGPGGHLRAFDLNGRDRWTVTTDGGVQTLTLLHGTVYAGGHFDHVCSTSSTAPNGKCRDGFTPRWKFLAVSAAHGKLTGWQPQANSTHGAYAMASDSKNGVVAAGGAWTTLNTNATHQAAFAQFR